MKKTLAEESEKTKRARSKLMRQIEKVEAEITPQALERKAVEIHRWIARHAPGRCVLRTKRITLFDGNQSSAPVSTRVGKLALTLKKEFRIEEAE